MQEVGLKLFTLAVVLSLPRAFYWCMSVLLLLFEETRNILSTASTFSLPSVQICSSHTVCLLWGHWIQQDSDREAAPRLVLPYEGLHSCRQCYALLLRKWGKSFFTRLLCKSCLFMQFLLTLRVFFHPGRIHRSVDREGSLCRTQ